MDVVAWQTWISLVFCLIGYGSVEACSGNTIILAQNFQQSLFSPGYPVAYNNSAFCTWTLFSATAGARIYIDVVDIDVDSSHLDCADNLAVYDGRNDTAKRLARMCERGTGNVFRSSTRGVLYIAFTSDPARVGKGFALRYWTSIEGVNGTNYPQCIPEAIRDLYIGVNPVRLELPDFGASSSDCQFRIRTDVKFVLRVTYVPGITPEYVNCSKDYLNIYDGSSKNGTAIPIWCSETGLDWFQSSGNEIFLTIRYVRMSALLEGPHTGIVLRQISPLSDECDLTTFPLLDVKFSPIFLWMPFAFQINGSACPISAGLRSVGPASELVITVLETSSRSPLICSRNYVQVSFYADTMEFLHQPKCSSSNLTYYGHVGHELVLGQPITMREERYLLKIQSQGFSCGHQMQTIFLNEQIVTSRLDIPLHEIKTTPCSFLFKAREPRHLVKLQFDESNLRMSYGHVCTGDHFIIHDGPDSSSPVLGKYCGQIHSRAPIFTSSSDSLFVELVTHAIGGFVHVDWEYSSYEDNRCFGVTDLVSDGRDKFIESPGYPRSYARNLDCWYRVTSSYGNPIVLELIDVNLPADCSDSITIYDGNLTSTVPLYIWCHSLNLTVYSTQPIVLLHLKTSSHSAGQRFNIKYMDNAPRFASTTDPRVILAICIIVGLANGVGGLFLFCFLLYRCRTTDSHGNRTKKVKSDKVTDNGKKNKHTRGDKNKDTRGDKKKENVVKSEHTVV